MGRSGKIFKALVAGAKTFKSPSIEKPEKDKSASKPGKKYHPKKTNKGRCLWSLGKSSSRKRDSLAAAVAFLDAPEIKSMERENKQVKDVPLTSHSFATKSGDGLQGVIAEDISVTVCDPKELVNQEQLAAVKIQAAYRRHLASQQVLRALRAVVRLQALSRGRRVRKQAATAFRCLQALVKVQALARGRHVRASELGQLIQKHLQQTRLQRKEPVEDLVSSLATLQQAKAQSKQDATMKQQCALVHAFSEQLNRCTSKQHPSSPIDFQPDKSDWGWVWLERWMTARPWGNPPGLAKEEHNTEEMVNVKADGSVDADSYYEDVLSLEECLGNSNTAGTSTEFVDDSIAYFQGNPSAVDKEVMCSVVKTKEEHMHDPIDVERVVTDDKSGIEASEIDNNSEIKKAAPRCLASPPPPPPLPSLYGKSARPIVTHQSSSCKAQQAASSVDTHCKMSAPFEVPPMTSSARAAELTVEASTNMLATCLKSSCDTKPASSDLPRSPPKDLIPSTSAPLAIEAFTIQNTFQSYPDSSIHHIHSKPTTSSIIPETDEGLLAEHDTENVSIPIPSASYSVSTTPSQPPSLPTLFSDVLVSPPQKHAIACSPLSIPDGTYDDAMPNGAHANKEYGIALRGDSTTVVLEPIHGFNGGMNPAECVFVDLENRLVEADMDVEEPEPIECKPAEAIQADSFSKANDEFDNECYVLITSAGAESIECKPAEAIQADSFSKANDECDDECNVLVTSAGAESIECKPAEAIQTDSFSKANGGCDALVTSPGEESVEVSPGKHTSPVSKQGQDTAAVSPSVPNYMTTTKSSKAKIRTLSSPVQKSESPNQKTDSPKPRFDTSKWKMDPPRLKYESPKQKFDSPKQKSDSPKQKLDSPKQKLDSATKRRHSLSALEGKGSPGAQKATQHVRVSNKGQIAAALKENSHRLNGDSCKHRKPVAV